MSSPGFQKSKRSWQEIAAEARMADPAVADDVDYRRLARPQRAFQGRSKFSVNRNPPSSDTPPTTSQ